ncbi:MAG TPA: ACP S-malonyltransferase [Candidatus Dormibacteraeota bacterium]|nr:ACP S-malonyltransferase [Candidatus Dormibacteraeota bacterium]
MAVAWIFPGQGSQKAGMGKELAAAFVAARRVFDEANDVLGFDLRRLCFEGPDDELQRTANAQPALLASSIAALAAARESAGDLAAPAVVAGHSLGEFSALVATEAIGFADALRLVRRRGELMQEADPSGGMLAVMGLDAETIARAIEGTSWVVANDNAPGQVVVSGPKAALEQASVALTAAGAKRVLPLRVSAAFHSPAMRPVGDALAEAMTRIPFRDARVPVVSNVDAETHIRASEFPPLLARQSYSPVRWVASVRRMEGEGVSRFVEFGAGAVLAGLVRRIAPAARAVAVQDPRSLEEATTVLR